MSRFRRGQAPKQCNAESCSRDMSHLDDHHRDRLMHHFHTARSQEPFIEISSLCKSKSFSDSTRNSRSFTLDAIAQVNCVHNYYPIENVFNNIFLKSLLLSHIGETHEEAANRDSGFVSHHPASPIVEERRENRKII